MHVFCAIRITSPVFPSILACSCNEMHHPFELNNAYELSIFKSLLGRSCWFESSYHAVATALGHRSATLPARSARIQYHHGLARSNSLYGFGHILGQLRPHLGAGCHARWAAPSTSSTPCTQQTKAAFGRSHLFEPAFG